MWIHTLGARRALSTTQALSTRSTRCASRCSLSAWRTLGALHASGTKWMPALCARDALCARRALHAGPTKWMTDLTARSTLDAGYTKWMHARCALHARHTQRMHAQGAGRLAECAQDDRVAQHAMNDRPWSCGCRLAGA